MNTSLEILQLAGALADHAAQRQTLISRNVAHADTPGYRAKDLSSFAESYQASDPAAMKVTRAGHMTDAQPISGARVIEDHMQGAEAPNGNTVSLEDQMLRGADVKMQHDLALGVYRKSLDILRLGLGRFG